MDIRKLIESKLFEGVMPSSWEDVFVPKDPEVQRIWNKLTEIRSLADGLKYIEGSKYEKEWMDNVKDLAVFDPDFYNMLQKRFYIDFYPDIDPYDWEYSN